MALISKAIIIVFLVFIFYALGSALYYLVCDRGDADRIVKALTWRIGLSLVLFGFLMVAFWMGWLVPHT